MKTPAGDNHRAALTRKKLIVLPSLASGLAADCQKLEGCYELLHELWRNVVTVLATFSKILVYFCVNTYNWSLNYILYPISILDLKPLSLVVHTFISSELI